MIATLLSLKSLRKENLAIYFKLYNKVGPLSFNAEYLTLATNI
jgi:hypothetical protein